MADNYVRHSLGERFILDMRVRLYAYLQRLSLSFFERTSTGELMSRVTNDVNALEQFVTHGTALTAVDLLRLVGAIAVLFVLNWQLALLVIIPVPLLVVGLRAFNTRVRPIYRRVRDRLGDINAQLQDNLAGMRVIQAFGQEERALQRFANESEELLPGAGQGRHVLVDLLPGHVLPRLAGHGDRAGRRVGDGGQGQPVAGHAGRLPGLHRLLLRADQPPDRGGQHLSAGDRRRRADL